MALYLAKVRDRRPGGRNEGDTPGELSSESFRLAEACLRAFLLRFRILGRRFSSTVQRMTRKRSKRPLATFVRRGWWRRVPHRRDSNPTLSCSLKNRYGITSTSIGPMVEVSGQDSQLENPVHEAATPNSSSTLATTISARPVSGGAGTTADSPSGAAAAVAKLWNGGAGPAMSSQWKYAATVEL